MLAAGWDTRQQTNDYDRSFRGATDLDRVGWESGVCCRFRETFRLLADKRRAS